MGWFGGLYLLGTGTCWPAVSRGYGGLGLLEVDSVGRPSGQKRPSVPKYRDGTRTARLRMTAWYKGAQPKLSLGSYARIGVVADGRRTDRNVCAV